MAAVEEATVAEEGAEAEEGAVEVHGSERDAVWLRTCWAGLSPSQPSGLTTTWLHHSWTRRCSLAFKPLGFARADNQFTWTFLVPFFRLLARFTR